jgi:YD repeat-containing protein
LLLLILFFATQPVIAQQCDNIVSGVSDSFVSSITIASTGQPIVNGSTIKVGTNLRFDVVATAYGQCDVRAMSGSPATCSVYATYERTVNHVEASVDIDGGGNGYSGTFSVGTFFGKNPNGTTAFLHVLDSSSPDTTGSDYFSPGWPGRYEFHLKAIYNQTACMIEPHTSETQTYVLFVTDGADPDLGNQSCPANIAKPDPNRGKPVNVTNGNMWLKQTDYRLSGLGADVDITRTYNSKMQRAGVFGYGWTSVFDESITQFGNMLLKLTLPDGQIVYFGRDTAGGVLTPRQPLDFHGQIVQGADGSYALAFKDGRVHRFDSSGKIISLADRNNNQTTITYDSGGAKPVSITDPGGRTLNLTYDSFGYVSTISDSLGTVATYTHGSWGRLLAVDYPDGSGYTFTDLWLSANTNVVTTVKDVLGNILEHHDYDSQGRATTSEVQGGVEKYTLTYTSATETDVTDALGHVTKYFFDTSKGRNLVTRIEGLCGCGGGSGSSQVTAWAYDDNLNLITKTDALGHATTYTYDAAGNPLTVTDATGTVTYTYNGFGEVLTRTDQMNGVTTMTYDANGNLLTVKNALNKTTTFTPDSHGLITEIKDPLNHETAFEYDVAGNLKKRTDAANNHTDFVYDARGRLISVTDPLNHTTSFEYDLAGKLKKITRPDNLAISYTYDLGGRRTKITDARGKETTFGYDGANRLTSVTDPLGHAVTYGYDLMSNRTSVTDALGHTTDYQYDDFNRLMKVIYPPATSGATRLEETTEYDAAGNVRRSKPPQEGDRRRAGRNAIRV